MPRTQHSRVSAGFTLLEVMVVVAVIGIVMGMAVVSIRDASSGAKTQAESRAVADAFVVARNHARALHRCVRIDLVSTQRIDLVVFDSCPNGVVGLAEPALNKTFTFDSRILVDSITTPSTNPLLYDPRGTTFEQGTTVVTVLGIGGASVSFEILPGIGQVRKR